MAFTKVVGAGIHTLSNITSHNINSSGIITATKFVGPIEGDITAVDATFTGNVSIAKTLTYEDVANVDSVGIVTARQGIQIPNDTYKLRAGTELEMQVWHDGSSSLVKDTRDDGRVRIQSDNFDIRDKDDSQTMISAGVDGSASLYYSGNQKLKTTSHGISVTGIGTFSDAVRIIKSSGPLLELTTNTGAADATLRLSEGTPGSTTNGGGMFYSGADNKLYITCGTDLTTKRITINRNNGYVGIHSTSPAYPLDVLEPTDNSGLISITGANTGYDTGLLIRNGNDAKWYLINDVNGSGGHSFEIRGDGWSSDRFLTLTQTGKLGIGTNAYGDIDPLAPLHVSSYSPTTTITTFNHLRDASQILCQTSNNVNDSRSGITFTGALHSTDGCSAGIIANHENVAENSETTSLSFYTSYTETLGERLRITGNGTVHTGMTGTAPTWLGNTMACREKFSVFQGANFGEACFNIDVDNANSFLSHNMYYDGGWKIRKSGSPVRHLEIGTNGWSFKTGADGSDDTGSALTERLRITPDGQLQLNKDQGGVTGRPTANRIIFKDADTSVAANQSIGEISWYSSDAGMDNVNSYIRGINEATNGSGALLFGVKAAGSSEIEALRITSGGNALFGGTGVSQTNRQLVVGSDAEANLAIETHNTSASETANIRFYRSRGTAASPTTLVDDDVISNLLFYGHDGTDYAHAAAMIRVECDGTVAGNQMPGAMSFHTNAGTTFATERLRIKSTGDVQIQVDGAGGASSQQGVLRFYRTGYSGDMKDSRIVFDTSAGTNNTDNATYCSVIAGKRTSSNNGSSDLRFYTCSNANSYAVAERLRITELGKVGIQTSSLNDVFEVHALGNDSDNKQYAAFERKTSANNKQAFGLVIRSYAQTSSGNEPTAYLRFDARPSSLNGSHGGNAIIAFSPIGVTQGTYGKGNLDFYLRSGGTYTFQNDPGGAGEMQPKLRIDPDGRVLIGTTDTLHSSGQNLIVGSGSGEEGMSIYSGSTSAGVINFADSNSGDGRYDGRILYNHGTSPYMRFHVGGGTERFRIYQRQTYGVDNYADTGTGQRNSSQEYPTGTFEWNNDTDSGIEKYNCYIQATGANETDMYITIRNAGFYRITIKASHNSTQADVAQYLVYGLNSQVVGNKITQVVSSGSFTVTNHNTHVNTYSSTIKIAYGTSCNQGLRALVEVIGGF